MIRPAFLLATVAAAALTGCEPPGKPSPDKIWKAPTKIEDFTKLYSQNCLGCHSLGETAGPSLSMGNPVYLASVTREYLIDVIANGVPNSRMPAFAERNGGGLTDEQIGIIADNILKLQPPAAGPVPPIQAPLGNAAAYQPLYEAIVANLQKTLDPKVFRDGFLLNPDFLGVVSDQYLRSLVIGGDREIGLPNFREALPGRALTDPEIADLVAWLSSHRVNEFGQPLNPANP